jgi:hypothetical protein
MEAKFAFFEDKELRMLNEWNAHTRPTDTQAATSGTYGVCIRHMMFHIVRRKPKANSRADALFR